MSELYAKIGQFAVMIILLAFSAFFSGTETAYFNLSTRDIEQLGKSKHRLSKLVAWLRNRPNHLLASLLLGNMIVNILYYAVSSVLIVKFREANGVRPAAILAGTSFAAILIFGEIIPKSISFANSRMICIFSALPSYIFMRLIEPVEYVLRYGIVEPALRLLLGPKKHLDKIGEEDFKILIDACKKHGYISDEENKLYGEVIELGLLKVRHVMLPRVDMITLDVRSDRKEAIKLMRDHGLTKVPVFVGQIDNIIGFIYLKDILIRSSDPLGKLVKDVNFVPEQQKVERLLNFFRRTGTDTAVVVDEYGGIAGLVSLEDIAAEILGPIETNFCDEPIKQIGPFKYRVSGNLAVHDWANMFGIEPSETKFTTVSGLVMKQLGKIPEAGDEVGFKNLKFIVEQVEHHRIVSLILIFEPLENE